MAWPLGYQMVAWGLAKAAVIHKKPSFVHPGFLGLKSDKPVGFPGFFSATELG